MQFIHRLFAIFALAGTLAGAAAASAAPAAKSEKILPSVISVDTTTHTAVLPLHRGEFHGKSVWYIITDASDRALAQRNHVVFSPSLATIGAAAIQRITVTNGVAQFAGIPDFSPTRTYVASESGFPPKSATPGSVGDAAYSPFVNASGMDGILNAPVVAVGDGPFDVTTHTNTEDRVIAIDTKAKTVTLVLARGFVNKKPVYYISTEASDPIAASVERATFVPKLAKADAGSTIPIGVVVNGPIKASAAQGLVYLSLHTPLADDATAANASTIASSFNVLSLVPNTAKLYAQNGYSPLWAVQVVPKNDARVTDYASYAALTPKPAGFLVNCPVIAFGDENAY